ncbi:MAG: hypothetical protein WCL30_03515 [Pseudomonadota bacterium]
MDKLGYEKEQIDDAMQEISLLTLGNVADITASKNNFTQLHIINDGDKMVNQHSNNLTYAYGICENQYNTPKPVNSQMTSGRNIFILQGKESRVAFVDGKSYAFHPNDRHNFPDMINFIYEQDNKTIIPSPAELFVAASVNNSRRNTKVDEFIPLPTTQALLEQMPHQARMLKSRMQNGLQL